MCFEVCSLIHNRYSILCIIVRTIQAARHTIPYLYVLIVTIKKHNTCCLHQKLQLCVCVFHSFVDTYLIAKRLPLNTHLRIGTQQLFLTFYASCWMFLARLLSQVSTPQNVWRWISSPRLARLAMSSSVVEPMVWSQMTWVTTVQMISAISYASLPMKVTMQFEYRQNSLMKSEISSPRREREGYL